MSGSGQAAVVNPDGTISTTSTAGTWVSIYVTGFGSLGAVGAAGLQRLTLPVTATSGDVLATVLYEGESPGFTTGLQQINLLIPANAPKGKAVPLVLTIGRVNT